MTHALRIDAGLIKLFVKTGRVATARRWQRAPFFSVGQSIYSSFDGDDEVMRAPLNSPAKPLPYDEFVLHLEGLFDDIKMDRGALAAFARVRAWSLVSEAMATQIAKNMPGVDPLYVIDGAILWEGMPELGGYWGAHLVSVAGGWRMGQPVYVVSNCTTLASDGGHKIVDDDETRRHLSELAENLHTGANNLVGYLMQSPKHLLSVRPTSPRVKPKTAQAMPWLRDDLPTIKLMGPDEALAAGQPRTVGGSVRAGPRPHARRGHWRRLGEGDDGTIRKTFVRPAWIGPEAWEHAGRQYSLLRAAGEGKAV